MKSLFRPLNKFRKDSRGTIAVITAIVIFPLLFYCAGVPIDLARQVQLRSALQNIADGAALAGSAVLGEGGTGAQACTIADNFVKASSSTGLSVPYSGLTPAAGTFATTASFVAVGTATANVGCPTTAPNTTTLAEVEATSPNQVSVTISANMPTAFMSFVKKTLPVTVTATAVGPANYITVCLAPNPTTSGDYNALYYYGITTSGALYTVGADGGTPASFKEGQSGDPSLDSAKSEFLEDDLGNAPTNNITPATPQCTSGFYKVFIHLPLATRIGFEMASEKGGTYPCLYASTYISNGALYNNGATSFSCMTSNSRPTIGQSAPALTHFYTDAYGTSVFTVNRYYSTDYPSTLNSSNTATILSTAVSGNSGTFNGTAGNFSDVNQSLTADTLFNQVPSNGKTGTDETYFNSYAAGVPSLNNSDIVCEVEGGQPAVPLATYPFRNQPGGTGYDFTNITIGNAQQENLVLQNTEQGALYKCANTTVGDPYNVNPTCKELNGATLNAGWNDMGGPKSDDVGYRDMPYSFQCVSASGVATLDFQNTALDQ